MHNPVSRKTVIMQASQDHSPYSNDSAAAISPRTVPEPHTMFLVAPLDPVLDGFALLPLFEPVEEPPDAVLEAPLLPVDDPDVPVDEFPDEPPAPPGEALVTEFRAVTGDHLAAVLALLSVGLYGSQISAPFAASCTSAFSEAKYLALASTVDGPARVCVVLVSTLIT